MRFVALIMAGGRGTRFGGDIEKPMAMFMGKPLIKRVIEAAKESKEEIKKALEGADMVFIDCGLGGGTGTGASPIVADIAKKLGALTVGIVTLPFAMEGTQRSKNAQEGLEYLESVVDTLIVIPNDKLLEIVPDVSILTAFKVADEILVNAVKGIAELITKPGLVNLDFADVRAIMSEGGAALMAVAVSRTLHPLGAAYCRGPLDRDGDRVRAITEHGPALDDRPNKTGKANGTSGVPLRSKYRMS